MISLKFAEKWLKLIALLHIIGGLLLPLLALTSFLDHYFIELQSVFPNSSQDSLRFLIGLFGPTVASWGLLFYFGIDKSFRSKARRDWSLLVIALLIWSILDSAYSLYFGIQSHFFINSFVLLSLLIPLCLVRKHFK